MAGSSKTAEACSQWLIREHLISTVPEDTSGAYLRAGATFIARDEEDEKRIADERSVAVSAAVNSSSDAVTSLLNPNR